jgi:hypothetical protein
MATAIWPASLPQYPLRNQYSEEWGFPVVQSEPRGPSLSRRTSTADPDTLPLSYQLTNAQRDVFRQFWLDVIGRGALPYTAPCARALEGTATYRITAAPRLTRAGRGWLLNLQVIRYQYSRPATAAPVWLYTGTAGYLYDNSNPNTMAQDSAGTIPVTAIGQPVGFQYDISGNGNHRRQTTSAKRPTFARVPRGGRRNVLTESEFRNGLSDAVNRSGLLTAAAMTIPSGATTAIAFGHNGSTSSWAYKSFSVTASTVTLSVYVQMDDGAAPSFGSATASHPTNDFALVAASGSSNPLSYTVTAVGGGVYRVSGSVTATGPNVGVVKYSGNSPRTFKVTGYQLEYSPAASAYQRVTQHWDVSESGVSALHCLYADGVDDALQTVASIDLSGTRAATFCCGHRKMADAGTTFLARTVGSTAAGTLALYAGSSVGPRYMWRNYDASITARDITITAGAAAPVTAVVTGVTDWSSATNAILRIDREQRGARSGDTGPAALQNIGWEFYASGSGGLLNGYVFAEAMLGRVLDDSELADLESWVDGRTRGVTL